MFCMYLVLLMIMMVIILIISKQKKEFIALKKLIKNKLSIIDFAHICCLFLVGNDKKITKVKETHCKKLKNLGLASPVRSHNPDKIIINHHLIICQILKIPF